MTKQDQQLGVALYCWCFKP